MRKVGKTLNSTIRNDVGNCFSKANDRWIAPTEKNKSPSPDRYVIGGQFLALSKGSTYRSSKKAVFGKD